MAPALATIFAFAPILLTFWLGPEYAAHSTTAVRVLSIGVLANALAHAPFVTLYALNRPDIPAKFHILELAVHIPLTYLLVRTYGISGAAIAWTARAILDLSLLLWAAGRQTHRPLKTVLGGTPQRTVAALLLLFALAGAAAAAYHTSILLSGVAELVAVGTFLVVSWRWVLSDLDRGAVLSIWRTYDRYLRRGMPARASTAEGS
jgi:O-antigen/teichoic acid export membrane protein